MLINEDCNGIELVKGNSLTIYITMVDESTGDPYILEEDDYVLFTVKGRKGTVIQKKLTYEDYVEDDENNLKLKCDIAPSDTVNLPSRDHKYDCLLVTSDGQAITFISSIFVLKDAIGLYTDIEGGVPSA